MRSKRDRSTLLPVNAFEETFLAAIDQLDEPMTAAEAEAAGPWALLAMPSGEWGVFRRGQSAERDVPVASFRRRETALLAAAVLPGTGRDPQYRLAGEPDAQGYALTIPSGEATGHVRLFDENLRDALHVAECLVRNPEALARLLEAAGGVALRETGRLLRQSEALPKI
ncbi:MAG TPA: hypothetical protein VH988_29425 [Thermoanaerobaculia bacterium]|jgi:hypothetical protein|nr:hypothetical protein [Thermoanaerobaculia bacterium]